MLQVEIKRGIVITLNDKDIERLNRDGSLEVFGYHDIEMMRIFLDGNDTIVIKEKTKSSLIMIEVYTDKIPNVIESKNYLISIKKLINK